MVLAITRIEGGKMNIPCVHNVLYIVSILCFLCIVRTMLSKDTKNTMNMYREALCSCFFLFLGVISIMRNDNATHTFQRGLDTLETGIVQVLFDLLPS